MSEIINLKDLNCEDVAIYNSLNENQLKKIYEPNLGLFIAESPKVIVRALDAGFEPVSALVEDKLLTGEMEEILPRLGDIPIYTSTEDILSRITGFKLTRGALCTMRRKELLSPEDIVKDARRIVILEDVENPTNVGAIFRSAAALNIDAVILTGGCSDPLYRRSIRVSMGNVFQVPWTFIGDEWYEDGISMLHKLGFRSAALALVGNSVSIDDKHLAREEKLAIIMGTEGEGLRKKTIDDSDYVVKIPMSNGVDSLNVAAASAVTFWELAAKKS